MTALQLAPTFVGREVELATLQDQVAKGSAGSGGMVFIGGDPGMGKSLLVLALQDRASQLPPPVRAKFVYGRCYVDVGANNPYQPFAESLGTLASPKGDIRQLVLSIITEVGPDVLDMIPGIGMIPVVGPGIKVAVKAGATAAQWLIDGDRQAALAGVLANQYVASFTKIAEHCSPLVLVIEDAHWIDGPSCQVLLKLARECHTRRLVLLVTYRPSYLEQNSPFGVVLREVRIGQLARFISLEGLDEQTVRTYLRLRFGHELDPELAAWLIHLCGGNPLFIAQYLSLLEDHKIIRRDADGGFVFDGDISDSFELGGTLASLPLPDSIDAVLEQRIDRLLADDQIALEVGSVQGQQFLSSVLVQVLNVKELDLLARLQRVAEEDRIITIINGYSWDQKSDTYTFEHILMQQAFYRKLTPRQRALYHSSVADALRVLLESSNQPARALILQMAYHYDHGQQPLLAATYYYRASESAFWDGALPETIELCQRALQQVRRLPAGVPEQNRLHAQIIQLLLLASRIQWRGKAELQGELPLLQLAQEGESAGFTAGDLSLLATIKYLQGMILWVTAGVTQSLAALKAALDLARQAGDDVGEFTIMTEYGHHLVAENLIEGLDVLYQAHEHYQTKVAPQFAGAMPAAVESQDLRLKEFIGVGEFDRGNFQAARQWLEESVSGQERLKRVDDLPFTYSFIGQLYTAIGMFEHAEEIYRKALDNLKTSEGPNAWRGYHLSLLGKLYLEWDRTGDAAVPMRQGWQETETTWNVDLVPLVRNYFAELLMRADFAGRDLSLANQLLDATIGETKQSGFHFGQIAALSLRGRLAMMNGHVQEAVGYSAQAVSLLKQFGTLPALRTEEVLFAHYAILQAAGQSTDAQPYLHEARAVLAAKLQSLADRESRRTFSERVGLSRAILAGDASFAIPSVDATPAKP